MQEENAFAHAGKYENKMHGCGHGGHVLMPLRKPGCHVWIGDDELKDAAPCHGLTFSSLHNSHYDFNDRLVDVGARYRVEQALVH